MAYRIAFLSDTHLGYSARCPVHLPSGLNMRVRDGYLGLAQTIAQIIEADVDLVIHGGDLFHRSHPSIRDITWARTCLERLASAGIEVIGATGNHDFANERGKSPATAAVHDPARGIAMVTEASRVLHPADGLNVHVVSHLGLLSEQRAIPEPVDGEANVLVAHGVAQVPGHPIFSCVDSPGEAVIGHDVLTLPWNATLLGHYHAMGPLPGFNAGPNGQAWYAGSLLRRGFSDPPGGRGWLLVEIAEDGSVSLDRRFVEQRAQFDLPEIDAAGLSGADVDERIRANLAEIDPGEAILRQRVINCPLPVRRGVDTAALAELVADALTWQLEFIRPADASAGDLADADRAAGSMITAGSMDLPAAWASWLPGYADRVSMPDALRSAVADAGAHWLAAASAVTPSATAPDAQPDADTDAQPDESHAA